MNCNTAGFPVLHWFPWVYSNSRPLSRWCHPTTSSSVVPFPWAFNVSQHQGLFQRVRSLHQVAKELVLQLQDQFFQWLFRLISFRIDWFDLPAVQGTLKSLLQHHNLKASVLWHSALFVVRLSHLYMTAEKTIALTLQIFVSQVMSLLFNTLSRFVLAILPRSKCHLIFWLQSLSTLILEYKKMKSDTVSIYFPSVQHEVVWSDVLTFVFWMLSCKPAFSHSSIMLIQRLFSLTSCLWLEWYHLHVWGCWYFSQQSWFQLVSHPAQHFAWCTLYIS